MLKEKRHLFEFFFMAADVMVIIAAWLAAYWIRFESGFFELDKGQPLFREYASMVILIAPVWAFTFRVLGLYKPMRGVREYKERELLIYANTAAILVFVTLVYLFREKTVPFSRAVFLWFWLSAVILTLLQRALIRFFLRDLRRKGYNLRYMLIVGAGDVSHDLTIKIRLRKELGIQLLGCCSLNGERDSGPEGLPVVGSYGEVGTVVRKLDVDQIVIALPLEESNFLPDIIEQIGDEIVDVKIIPDLYRFVSLGGSIEEFEGLPVIGIQGSPLEGAGLVVKRIFDICFASLLLVLFAPVMCSAAILVKLTSRGPILYRQERLSLDGTPFNIIKFRTMKIDAEQLGAGWTTKRDPRVTFIGRILRVTSLDELPQFFNVLKGDMSIVGPRPERPVYIDEFRKRIPRYMLRHKVPAGITGWAQINGWRGDTSIDTRIDFDLYYIENWSLLLDIRILFVTVFKGFFHKNAY